MTAYARRNLFSGIIEFGTDYIYSDTDSIKARNIEKHMDYIERYNYNIGQKLVMAMEYHGIPIEATRPKTKDGIEKPMGVWDFDGHMTRFKTLGAKRYLVEYSQDERNGKDKGKIKLTVSGLNKQKCVPWMLKKWGKDSIFQAFNNGLYVPPEYTGKMTHTYIDEERKGIVLDYLGQPGEYDELSGVHLEAADYSLSISREYADFIADVQNDDW